VFARSGCSKTPTTDSQFDGIHRRTGITATWAADNRILILLDRWNSLVIKTQKCKTFIDKPQHVVSQRKRTTQTLSLHRTKSHVELFSWHIFYLLFIVTYDTIYTENAELFITNTASIHRLELSLFYCYRTRSPPLKPCIRPPIAGLVRDEVELNLNNLKSLALTSYAERPGPATFNRLECSR
jgi:hypothetical protein